MLWCPYLVFQVDLQLCFISTCPSRSFIGLFCPELNFKEFQQQFTVATLGIPSIYSNLSLVSLVPKPFHLLPFQWYSAGSFLQVQPVSVAFSGFQGLSTLHLVKLSHSSGVE